LQGEKGQADVVSNVWKSNPWPLKVAKVAYRCAWKFEFELESGFASETLPAGASESAAGHSTTDVRSVKPVLTTHT
jgi:hypothetical protein